MIKKSASSGVYWAKGLDDQERADRLRDFFGRDRDSRASRRETALCYASAVEGMVLSSLGPYGYDYDIDVNVFDGEDFPIIRNTAHEQVATLVAKIGANNPPIPEMLTTRGNWPARRQAQDARDLVRAEYTRRQGQYADLHQLWIAALRICSGATGAVAVQFFAHGPDVGARIHDTLDMAWSECKDEQASVTWLPVEDMVCEYPDHEDLIRRCAGVPPPEWRPPSSDGYVMDQWVAVYEGYSASRHGRKGVKIVCLNEGPALEADEWEHSRCPYVWLVCVPHMYGPLGHCFIHHVWESFKRDQYLLAKVDRAIGKATSNTTYAHKGSLVDPSALLTTGDHRVIELNPGATVPTDVMGPGFAPEHLTVADRHYEIAHNVTGLSEMQSQGVREEGIPSASGQRYIASLVNQRFADLQGRYEHAVAVESAECILMVLCDIVRDDPKLMRLTRAEDSLRELSAKVALKGIDSIKYTFRPAAVSGSVDDPPARMQTGFEMMQLNLLSKPAYAGLQGNGMDLPAELEREQATIRWTQHHMYRWAFAPESEREKPDFYVPPFEHIDPLVMLPLLIDGYQEAQLEELEPERLEYFLMAIADVKEIARRTTAASAPPTAAPPITGPAPIQAPTAF